MKAPTVRRMHFREDGEPKQPLAPKEAARPPRRGLRTYLCPLCGETHAASKGSRPDAAEGAT